MNAKFSLAIVALVSIGMFALPSTMSLFAGQHSFYNIDATGNQIPCVKCHGDVKAELTSNAVSGLADYPNTPGPHANFKCEYCHRAEPGYASGDNAYGVIIYSGGSPTVYRYMAVTVKDFESENFPTTINGTDAFPNTRNAGVTTYGRNFTGGGAAFLDMNGVISQTNAVATMGLYAEYLRPAYSGTTGEPLDTNASTRYAGLDLGQVLGFTGSGRSARANLTNAGSKAVNPGTEYHAASLVSCMECHRGSEPLGHYSRLTLNGSAECSNCHYGYSPPYPLGARWTELAAGGFGLTSDPEDTGTAEAHDEFTKNSNVAGILRYKYNTSNAACVACHTHVAVDINFTKKYKIKLDAVGTGTGTWNVGGLGAEGGVQISVFGNQSGETYATSSKTYDWTPGVTLYDQNGNLIQGLSADASDNQTALTTP